MTSFLIANKALDLLLAHLTQRAMWDFVITWCSSSMSLSVNFSQIFSADIIWPIWTSLGLSKKKCIKLRILLFYLVWKLVFIFCKNTFPYFLLRSNLAKLKQILQGCSSCFSFQIVSDTKFAIYIFFNIEQGENHICRTNKNYPPIELIFIVQLYSK